MPKWDKENVDVDYFKTYYSMVNTVLQCFGRKEIKFFTFKNVFFNACGIKNSSPQIQDCAPRNFNFFSADSWWVY